MKIKFKDGITIEVSDTEGKSKKDIVAEAKEIHEEFIKDAKLRRTFYTNTAFSATEIKEAIAEANWRKLDKELKLLDRDIDTDIRRNQNYTERYSKEQLKKIIKAYQDVVAQLRRIEDNETYANKANEIDAKINTLKENWSINDSLIFKAEAKTLPGVIELDKIEKDYFKYLASKYNEYSPELLEKYKKYLLKEGYDSKQVESYVKSDPKYAEKLFNELKEEVKKFEDSKSVKDVPPYYDPSVTVGQTGTKYSTSRIEKADRYNDKTMLELEYDGIIEDLEEYIQDTTDFDDPENVLHTYRKDELRKITADYYELAKIYKRNGLEEESDNIKALTDTLYQRWHLGA